MQVKRLKYPSSTYLNKQIKLENQVSAFNLVNKNDEGNNDKTQILNPKQKTLLFHSLANYLERSGFSSRSFVPKPKSRKNDLIDSSFDLEEVFNKFLDMHNNVAKNSKSHKVQGVENKKNPAHDTISAEVKSKEKKRNEIRRYHTVLLTNMKTAISDSIKTITFLLNSFI